MMQKKQTPISSVNNTVDPKTDQFKSKMGPNRNISLEHESKLMIFLRLFLMI